MSARPSYGTEHERGTICPHCHRTVSVLWHVWNGRDMTPPVCRECCTSSNITAANNRMLARCTP